MIKVSKDNNLSVRFPEIAKEWHPTLNGNSKPERVMPGSHIRAWWKCPKGDDHVWDTTINSRTSGGYGCPYCANQKVSKDNNLFVLFPYIAKEWHPTLNGNSKPEGVLPGSGQKVWWKCPKGDDHVWKAKIMHRSRGSGCPYCSGRKVSKDNNLLFRYPEVAKEWHPTKNKDSTPEKVTPKSSKMVRWQCTK